MSLLALAAFVSLIPGTAVAGSPADAQAPPVLQTPEPVPAMKFPSPPAELGKLLQERQEELDRREAVIRKDEERLRVLRQDIGTMLKKQGKAGAALAQGQPGGAAARGMPHLSQAFESMPPEEAAQRIEKMSDPVAVDLLARLKSKTTGQILAAVNPAKAARLVEKLAAAPPRAGSAEGPPGRK